MYTAFTSVTWDEALKGFTNHVRAVRAAKTYLFYERHTRLLKQWAQAEGISLEDFGKRHLDEYLIQRAETGLSQMTLHHDSLCAKVLFKWCKRDGIITRDPLADYEVRNAPKPAKYMPSDEVMVKLVSSIHSFWDVTKHPEVRYSPATKRSFHRDRNYAILLTLLDSACRIGEALSFKMDDCQASQRMITVRIAKGREPRTIPVSRDCADAIGLWLKVRARVMANVAKEEDEGWLFISETGTRIDEGRFLRATKKFASYAGPSDNITLHSLRRYSLNRLAKHNLLAAQSIAGHKDTKTTLIYTKIDPDFVRQQHEEVGVLRGILNSKRAEKRKRLV